MGHDVYICYDENDREVCDAICATFEDNGIRSWVKHRDFASGGPVELITAAIADSKCFVLIYSKNSRDKNHVEVESDIAFSNDVPIISFNIDNSKIGRNLEFILQNQKKMNLFPDSKGQLERLVRETSGTAEKPIGNVRTDSKNLKVLERLNPERRGNALKKYGAIAVGAVAVLVLIYLFVIAPAGQHTTDDGTFAMNVTGVDVDGLKYTVRGESYNMPSDSVNYFMNIKFFDKNDDVVYEVNSTADEFNSGVIWSGNLHDDNVTHVGFKLTDISGNTLSNENYVVE